MLKYIPYIDCYTAFFPKDDDAYNMLPERTSTAYKIPSRALLHLKSACIMLKKPENSGWFSKSITGGKDVARNVFTCIPSNRQDYF